METVGANVLLRSGREALAAADWEGARSCFEHAREREETPEVLDGLSEVAHFAGEYERAIELKERAFAAYRRDGKRVQAADLARWLAFLHASCHGNLSAASGCRSTNDESGSDGVALAPPRFRGCRGCRSGAGRRARRSRDCASARA
jgi:tetratricopeptide (TPR) repeat protein